MQLFEILSDSEEKQTNETVACSFFSVAAVYII